ncbi:TPA: hypothetical protein ACGPAL_001221, partial [Streptococcus suis]
MKKTILFLSICTLVLGGKLVYADTENMAPYNAGGQASVVEENGRLKSALVGVTGDSSGSSSQTSSTDAESSFSVASQGEGKITATLEEVLVSADSSLTSSTAIDVFNDSETSTTTRTSSSTSSTASSTSTSSTRSASSVAIETSSATSSIQEETQLRSVQKSMGLSGKVT